MKRAGAGCEKRWQLGLFSLLVPQESFHSDVARVHRYMEKRVDDVLASASDTNGSKRLDFLACLAQHTTDWNQLRDEACVLFIAAADTLASLLINIIFLVGKYPSVWARLRMEIEPLGGQSPSPKDLKQLKYHGYCVREGGSKGQWLALPRLILVRSSASASRPSKQLSRGLLGHRASCWRRAEQQIASLCTVG